VRVGGGAGGDGDGVWSLSEHTNEEESYFLFLVSFLCTKRIFRSYNRNTDKMTDEEKLPIALAGLAGISFPFILGLIALYAAKG